MIKRFGFTLAEVLITLGIIGVVAAMTIPTLITNYQEKVTVTKLKSTYSLLTQATKMVMLDNNGLTLDMLEFKGDTFEDRFTEEFPKYLKVQKICNARETGCMPRYATTLYNDDDSKSQDWYYKKQFLLNNGVAIAFGNAGPCTQNVNLSERYGTYTTQCGEIYVDINGQAKPNKKDEDIFKFTFVKDGVVPAGSQRESVWTHTFYQQCLGNKLYDINYGGLCTAWVIENENLDYKRCPEKLDWTKSRSCKE